MDPLPPTPDGETPEEMQTFILAAEDVLARTIPPLATEEVLKKLTSATTRDLRLVTEFKRKPMVAAATNAGEQTELRLPLHADAKDLLTLSYDLDTHASLRGERTLHLEMHRGIDLIAIRFVNALLHKKSDAWMKPLNLLQGWYEYNESERVGLERLPIDVIRNLPDAEQEKIRNYLMQHMILPDDEYSPLQTIGLHALAGGSLYLRLIRNLKHRKAFPRSVDAAAALVEKSKKARDKLLLSLGGFKYIAHARLAESIVRQGYRTLLSTEEMTEHDIWAAWKKKLWEKIEDFTGKMIMTPEGAALQTMEPLEDARIEIRKKELATDTRATEEDGAVDLEIDKNTAVALSEAVTAFDDAFAAAATADADLQSPEMTKTVEGMIEETMKKFSAKLASLMLKSIPHPEQYLSTDDQKAWKEADAYLASHGPQERKKLTEAIGCAEYRKEMSALRRQYQWNALAAKERELAHRVYGSVIQIPYDSDSDHLYERKSYLSGTPEYAAEQKRLTCFTGPWLMAALLQEAGIPYHNLYYCNVNESPEERAASHGALLMKCSDGTCIFLDYGFRQCGRPFTLSLLEWKSEQRELGRLFLDGEKMSELGQKFIGYPAHVRVDGKIAKTLKICSDMHVMPLDQGLTGVSLLHAGIAFEEEGKPDEAEAAYEMGLVSYPNNPDILCRLATIALRNKDLPRAEHLLTLSLNAYGGHIHSWYYAGILALEQGDEAAARTHFERIRDDKRAPWGDDMFKKNATRYCDQLDDLKLQREKISLTVPDGVIDTEQ